MSPTVALKETCRAVIGRPFPDAVPLWRWHLARLEAGGCDAAELAAVERAAIVALADYGGPAGPRVRLTVVAEPDGTAHALCERRLSSLDVPAGPIVALVSVTSSPPLPEGLAKPADRSPWDAAQARARRLGAHQALLVGPEGAIIDGGTATLWLVTRGTLVTPPAPPAIPGVARAWLLEHASDLRLPIEVRRVSPEDLDTAEELFLTNAFAGGVPVRGRGGRTAQLVGGAFAHVWT